MVIVVVEVVVTMVRAEMVAVTMMMGGGDSGSEDAPRVDGIPGSCQRDNNG